MPERKYKEVAHKLTLKYGLQNEPTDSQVNQWHLFVLVLKLYDYELDRAAAIAADKTFDDYGTIKYASQADTIEALLAEIERIDKKTK